MTGCAYLQFYEFDIFWKFIVWKLQLKGPQHKCPWGC